MIRKKIAFLFERTNIHLASQFFDDQQKVFFLEKAMRRESWDYTVIPLEKNVEFDFMSLSGFDYIWMIEQHQSLDWSFPIFKNRDKITSKIMLFILDAHSDVNKYSKLKELAPDVLIHRVPKEYITKYLGRNTFNYKFCWFGFNSDRFRVYKGHDKRIKRQVLNSGIILENAPWYKLRTEISLSREEYVFYQKYNHNNQHENFGREKYNTLLNDYFAAFAACSVFPVGKYLELPAAGCLTFQEVTEENQAKQTLKFKDGESSIFITKSNWKEKVLEYIENPNDVKWLRIIKNGIGVVHDNYRLEVIMNELDEIMESL